jgi:Trk-type K+ transport system membrane component
MDGNRPKTTGWHNGTMTKKTEALKRLLADDRLRMFLAIVALITGALLLVVARVWEDGFWWWDRQSRILDWAHINQAFLGVTLLSAGLTHFLYRGRR